MLGKAKQILGTQDKSKELQEYAIQLQSNVKNLTSLLDTDCVPEKTLGEFRSRIKVEYEAVLSSALKVTTPYFVPTSWAEFTKKIDEHNKKVQSLFMSWNTILNQSIAADKSNIDAIFKAKRDVYKFLDKDNLDVAVKADREFLTQWNDALTVQAENLFKNKSELAPDQVNAIFDNKKIIARHLYALEAPINHFEPNYFQPLEQSIEALKQYLTNEADGRYRNIHESTNAFGWGVSRTTKLADTLGFCNQIVLNTTGAQLTRTAAHNQGRLNVTVNRVMTSFLAGYFSAFMDMISRIFNPPTSGSTPAPIVVSLSSGNLAAAGVGGLRQDTDTDASSKDDDTWTVVSSSDTTSVPDSSSRHAGPTGAPLLTAAPQPVKNDLGSIQAKVTARNKRIAEYTQFFNEVCRPKQRMSSGEAGKQFDISTLYDNYLMAVASHQRLAEVILKHEPTSGAKAKAFVGIGNPVDYESTLHDELHNEKKAAGKCIERFSDVLTETATALFLAKALDHEKISRLCDVQIRLYTDFCAATGHKADERVKAGLTKLKQYIVERCKEGGFQSKMLPKVKAAMSCYKHLITTGNIPNELWIGINSEGKTMRHLAILDGRLGSLIREIQYPKIDDKQAKDEQDRYITAALEKRVNIDIRRVSTRL